jgi:hypothetical protein
MINSVTPTALREALREMIPALSHHIRPRAEARIDQGFTSHLLQDTRLLLWTAVPDSLKEIRDKALHAYQENPESRNEFLRISGGIGLPGEEVGPWLEEPWQPRRLTKEIFDLFTGWMPPHLVTWAKYNTEDVKDFFMRLLFAIRLIQWQAVVHLADLQKRPYRGMPITILTKNQSTRASIFLLRIGLEKVRTVSEIFSKGGIISSMNSLENFFYQLKYHEELMAAALFLGEVKAAQGGIVNGISEGFVLEIPGVPESNQPRDRRDVTFYELTRRG